MNHIALRHVVLGLGLILLPASTAEATPPDTWDKNLPSHGRFTVLHTFHNQAVRDNNTGLVWEQAPQPPDPMGIGKPWSSAILYCANKTVGGTVGWRLPSIIELKSIQDPTLPPPFVPTSVFTVVQSTTGDVFYWSATTVADNPPVFPDNSGLAWAVNVSTGLVVSNGKVAPDLVWCVRGPMQESVY